MKILPGLMVSMMLGGSAVAQEQNLFNGKDLAGWDGKPGWWTVEDGAITSESTPEKPCKKANYLVWTGGEPADFELTLDFKLSPDSPKSNSGVQIRSERRPDWDTFGYQADMDAVGGLVGYVYHHGRGLIAARGEKVIIAKDGKRTAEKVGDAEELKAVFKPGEWNHYRIVCRGPDITLYVNDMLMCEFSDHDQKQARSKGIIALQMHPGPPMKVQFMNISLKPMDASAAMDPETELVELLLSNTGVQEKADACRQLRQIGTSAAVPALAALLADENLSHMARYALQVIPDAAAGKALRDALGTLSGEPLAGLVSTIGSRRDEKAVAALVDLLQSDHASVAEAASLALGQIGTAAAARGLETALKGAGDVNRIEIFDGLFRCAESFSADGKNDAALALYDALRIHPQATEQVKAGALRGAILVRGPDGLNLFTELLRSDDEIAARAASQAALEWNGSGVVQSLVDVMGAVPPGRQVLLAGVLGKLGDNKALTALFMLAKDGEPSTRLAAIRAAAEIGGIDAAAPLIALLKDSDEAVAQAAETGLAGLRGDGVDDVVLNALNTADPALKNKLVEITARRRVMKAKPVLAGLMKDPDETVRLAAVKHYGQMASTEDLPVLLDTIKNSTQADDITALGKAIVAAYRNGGEQPSCVPQIAATLDQATDEAKPTLTKVLQRVGGPEAL